MRTLLATAALAATLAGSGLASALAAPDDPAGRGPVAKTLAKPPGKPGTIAYNRWLGRSFNDTLLNERSQAARVRILNRIVSPRYIQHNPLAPEVRDGLVAFIPVIYASFPDVRFTVRDGKLCEHWDQFDWTRAIHQITTDDRLPAPFVQVADEPVDR